MSKEINEPTICPHCEKPLQRIDMTRDDSGAEPMWLIRIAGRMNAAAVRNIAKLMRGWTA